MLSLHSKIPSFVSFVLVKGQPAGDDLHLLSRQRARQQLAVNRNNCLVLPLVNMNMGLVVLSYIAKKHIYDHTAETT